MGVEAPTLPSCLPTWEACASVCSGHSTHSSLQNTAGETGARQEPGLSRAQSPGWGVVSQGPEVPGGPLLDAQN